MAPGRGCVWGTLVVAAVAGCGASKVTSEDAGDLPDGGATTTTDVAGDGAGPVACEDRFTTTSWTLTPAVSELPGTVTAKAMQPDGTEQITITSSGPNDFRLDLKIEMAAPFAVGDVVELKVSEFHAFALYRTLEVKKAGESVLYISQVSEPSLPPPPVLLQVGEQSCAWSAIPSGLATLHKLQAMDTAAMSTPVTIDVGQKATVGRYRVFNDVVMQFGPGVLDAHDLLQVVVVRMP